MGFFDVDNSLSHLNDQWTKIEAVVDSGAAESVAPADVAPWYRSQNQQVQAGSDIHESVWRETHQSGKDTNQGLDQRAKALDGKIPMCRSDEASVQRLQDL